MTGISINELVIILALLAFVVLPSWRIFERVGHPGWYGLGMVIPLLNIILLFFLAYSEWPTLKRVR